MRAHSTQPLKTSFLFLIFSAGCVQVDAQMQSHIDAGGVDLGEVRDFAQVDASRVDMGTTLVCELGQDVCDTQCVNTQTSPMHCGACHTPCSGVCTAGTCTPGARLVAAGGAHSCALMSDMRIYCWGENADAQCGVPDVEDQLLPVQVPGLPPLTFIASGERHSCALDAAGAAWCWGDNTRGQLGHDTLATARTPQKVRGLDKLTALSAGKAHTCALKDDGNVYCWGDNDSLQIGRPVNVDLDPSPERILGITNATEISAGDAHTCALTLRGDVLCWGENRDGQLGAPTPGDEPLLVPLARPATQLSAGRRHTCALLDDANIWCWGDNSSGALGATSEPGPVQVSAQPGPAAQLSLSSDHACAVFQDATISCWGSSLFGKLGLDGVGGEQLVALPNFPSHVQVSSGRTHVCSVREDASIWCWGSNLNGALGLGVKSGANKTPFAVDFLAITQTE